jgi:hypothetical protein
MNKLGLTLVSACLSCSYVSAQEVPRFTGDIGGGFTQPVGTTGTNLNEGWNIQGGFGVNFSPYIGAKIDLGYNHFNLSSFALNSVGAPGGDVQIFSATLDPIVHLNPRGHVDVYLVGGGGEYHWYQEFTQPTISTFEAFNPFLGYYPVAVPGNQILGSYSVNKPGVNGGAGIALGTRFHGKFFAEARYTRIFFSNGHADYVPVSFGFRW